MTNKRLFSENPYKLLLCTLSCILWGSAFPVLKISYKELQIAQTDILSKILLAGIRFLLASLIIFLFIKFILKSKIIVTKNNLMKLSILGLFQTSMYYFLFYIGVSNTTGIKGSIIGAAEVFLIILLAHFNYKDDKITIKKLLGLILGFSGILIANWGQTLGVNFSFKGEGLLIISSLLGAVCAILIKKFSLSMNTFLITAWQMFIGSLFLLAFGLPSLFYKGMIFNLKGFLLLIYSSFLSAIAFSIWFTLLKYNKAGEISLYRFIIPVSGVMLSAIFLPNEKFTLNIIIALLLVVMGIILVNKNSKNT